MVDVTNKRSLVKKRSGNPNPVSRQGKTNKSKSAIVAMLQRRYPDYQPVVEMADAAMSLTTLLKEGQSEAAAKGKTFRDTQLMLDVVTAHEKVAKYVTPQLKAMDITSGGEQVQFGFTMNLAAIVGPES